MVTRRTPGIEALVEHQAARWDLARHTGRTDASAGPEPCLAFSRLPHASGDTVAERVATLLDYGLFGSVALGEIARQHGIHESLVAGLDERMRGVIDRYMADVFSRHGRTGDEYFREMMRIVSTIGQRGRAVLVGRGAPFILSPEHTLRVLVVASREAREQRCASESGIPLDQARAQLAESDRQRREYLNFYFRIPQDDRCFYDLVVNTDRLGIDEAAHVVAEAFRRRFPPV